MKKLIVLLLIVSLVLPSAASADDSTRQMWRKRFVSLDDAELNDVLFSLQTLLFERGASANGVCVPSGIYTVGVDLPAGTYRIEYRPLLSTSFCSFMATNHETFFGYHTLLGLDGSTEIGKIDLTDGTVIELSGGDVYFYTYAGLFH